MVYKTDYHIHSYYSDGRSAPEDYIAPAIAAGLSELGFSEHLTLFKDLEDWNMNPVNISPYMNHIENLRNTTKNIIIKTGLEVDFFAGKENEIREFLCSLPLDYIIDNDIIIAYKMNDIALPPERGFPFELVAEDKWGYKWIKWVTKIELSNDPNYRGYWESRGYNNSGDSSGPERENN